MMFLGVVLFIYCIIGVIVGVVAFTQHDYPVMNEDTDTYDILPTAKFFLVCGPFFWVLTGFYFLFKWGYSLLDKEDD
jgi:hypothetical protein